MGKAIVTSDLNEKISIIIPVYNAQEYLEKCLNSILLQSYANFEVICVDDGSTDNSGELCEKFREKDKRFRVFHVENHGVSYARNYALSLIEGAWFCFVDADDWIEPNYLDKLHSIAVQNECDVAACSFYKEGVWYSQKSNKGKGTLILNSPKECVHNFICDRNSMHGMVWNKIYATDRFQHLRFRTNISINEDCLYTYDVMKICRKACMTMESLYHWVIRKDSACHAKAKVAEFHAADVFKELYQLTIDYQDREIIRTLQRNYICAVVRILNSVIYEENAPAVIEAKKQCKLWKKQVWPIMSMRKKLEYLWAFYGIGAWKNKKGNFESR